MSLPSSWVEKLWAKLAMTYGQRFLGLYAGLDLDAVKSDWAHELSGYEKNPDAIRHALENLPVDRPPNVLEFRQLCRSAPVMAPKALPAPNTKADPAILAKVAAAARGGDVDPRAWAFRLARREVAGDRLTMSQREAWRQCLGADVNARAADVLPQSGATA